MYVKDRLVFLEAHAAEQRRFTPKMLPYKRLMIAGHCDDQVCFFDQVSTHLTLDMGTGIGTFELEFRLDPFVNHLRLGRNAGGSNQPR